jgi:hypothetical protein
MPLDGRFDKKNCVGQIGRMERRPPAQSRRIGFIRLKQRRQQSGNRTTGMGAFYGRISGNRRALSRFNSGTAYGHKVDGNNFMGRPPPVARLDGSA